MLRHDPTSMLAETEEILFAYRGRSMWPLLQEGDTLVVSKVRMAELRIGDCVVFWYEADHRRIVHRVISVAPDIRTKGDANAFEDDSALSAGCLDGRVEAKIRYGRRSKVAGGKGGLLMAKFFQIAGFLDPYQRGRGGAISRAIQSILCPLLVRATKIVNDDNPCETPRESQGPLLFIGTLCIGSIPSDSEDWQILWPYSLLVNSGRLQKPRLCSRMKKSE